MIQREIESYKHFHQGPAANELRAELTKMLPVRFRLSEIGRTYLRCWIASVIRQIRAIEWPDLDNRPGNYYVTARDHGRSLLVAGPYPSHRIAKRKQDLVSVIAERHDPWAAFYSWGTARLQDGERVREAALQRLGYSLAMNPNDHPAAASVADQQQ